MDLFKRSYVYTIIALVGLIWGFFGGIIARDRLPLLGGSTSDLPILNQAHSILLNNGYDPPPEDPALEYGMIRGMIQAYDDPFTSFLEPVHTELESQRLQGSFGGIGATLGNDLEGYVVLFPLPDSPAQAAGVLEGDRLLQVNDLTIDPGLSIETVLSAVRGPVGQRVTLTIASPPDYTPRRVTIRRQEIALPSVSWHLDPADPRLGMIEINVIADSTPDEIVKAVNELTGRGAEAFVLDLRNNGGGLLTAGVKTARLFLDQGEVMRQQYRGKSVETFKVDRRGQLADLPVVVLVNNYTASAAEIIAGALQSQGRALLIGSPTFGKNTVQLVFTLQDGSSLHVTAAKWWFEGFEFPREEHGLFPDIAADDDPIALSQAALTALFKDS